MKTAIATAASFAIAATLSLAAFAPANADTLRRATGPTTTAPMKIQSGSGPTAAPFDNTAHAWTSACYAEFGPDAKYPDPALLEKCLNF
ncbi:hypothetical protein [Hoeflea sp. TYP-13]|uniref:hypothetical protein n=1 Tax=Hoeflea sp. TYP-13 TaxID=3230023 RepID=UPI0034C67A51